MDYYEWRMLDSINQSIQQVAVNSAMPEFAKEANFLAGGIYSQKRLRTEKQRMTRTLPILATIGLLVWSNWLDTNLDVIVHYNNLRVHLDTFMGSISKIGIPIILLLWVVNSAANKSKLWADSMNEAWEIVNEKQRKEAVIRQAMYEGAAARLGLSHEPIANFTAYD
jgi:hypothetical protein